jgi:hypothetical protein
MIWFTSGLRQAEAEYWRRSEGYRIGWSDQLLGFDCGGQQWVLEVALPTGNLRYAHTSGLLFVYIFWSTVFRGCAVYLIVCCLVKRFAYRGRWDATVTVLAKDRYCMVCFHIQGPSLCEYTI